MSSSRLTWSKQYLEQLQQNILLKTTFNENTKRTTEFEFPTIHQHNCMKTQYYTIVQLRDIAKHYQLKTSGNKTNLTHAIYCHLLLARSAIILQRTFRRRLQKKYVMYHGPAYFKRSLCVNDIDFLSMDSMDNIPSKQFFSFKDADGFIYGFDIRSLHMIMSEANPINPFTQKQLILGASGQNFFEIGRAHV